ncbi:MAG: indolepyruvate oxidoreductase subunit beta [Clostridia bacterium]|nr:indolepyruvate oxidoreductase subunit beta [Clostridia bacterium]
MTDNKSILIVGVGGQGTLLASRILGKALTSLDYDVKVSEVHGMSQRGGSVETYVKYGEKVFSPIIKEGEADIILSFELLEAARYLPFLKIGGKVIVNTQKIDPMSVVTGKAEYPSLLEEKIIAKGAELTCVDALALAKQAGSVKAVNIVLIGVMASHSEIEKQVWLDAVVSTVPEKFRELNIKAFELGYGSAK